jgi:hypothetical protein
LQAELRPLAERAAIRLLADEGEPARLQLARYALEPLGAAREVAPAQIARSRCRAVRGIRDPDALLQQLELLGRVVEAGREVRRVQQPPEVVARVGEVRVRRGGDPPRIDAAEDDVEARRQDVGDVALRRGYAASAASSPARPSIRSSRRLRMSSPETVVGKRGRRGSRRTIETVGS